MRVRYAFRTSRRSAPLHLLQFKDKWDYFSESLREEWGGAASDLKKIILWITRQRTSMKVKLVILTFNTQYFLVVLNNRCRYLFREVHRKYLLNT